jgi:hypothetical protein
MIILKRIAQRTGGEKRKEKEEKRWREKKRTGESKSSRGDNKMRNPTFYCYVLLSTASSSRISKTINVTIASYSRIT